MKHECVSLVRDLRVDDAHLQARAGIDHIRTDQPAVLELKRDDAPLHRTGVWVPRQGCVDRQRLDLRQDRRTRYIRPTDSG